jgi:DNA-binding MarR family transcriptional regulator
MSVESNKDGLAPRLNESPDPSLDFGFLPKHIIHHYRLLNLELTRLHAKLFKDTPMERGVGKMTTLMLVAQNPGLTQTAIAKAISKDKAAVARIVDELEREGLIIRTVVPEERRAYSLDLSERGQRALREYEEITKQCESDFSEGLSGEEKRTLLALLKKLRRLHDPEGLGID